MGEHLKYLIWQYGGLAVFTGLFLDSVIAIIPGDTLLVLASFYRQLNNDPVWPIYVYCVLGAWLGAYTSYFIGRKLGKSPGQFLSKLGVTPKRVRKVNGLIERYGIGVLILARVIPGSRQVVYYLAGLGKMPALKFHGATLAGILPWAGIVVFAGSSLQAYRVQVLSLFRQYGNVLTIALILTLLICYYVWGWYLGRDKHFKTRSNKED